MKVSPQLCVVWRGSAHRGSVWRWAGRCPAGRWRAASAPRASSEDRCGSEPDWSDRWRESLRRSTTRTSLMLMTNYYNQFKITCDELTFMFPVSSRVDGVQSLLQIVPGEKSFTCPPLQLTQLLEIPKNRNNSEKNQFIEPDKIWKNNNNLFCIIFDASWLLWLI